MKMNGSSRLATFRIVVFSSSVTARVSSVCHGGSICARLTTKVGQVGRRVTLRLAPRWPTPAIVAGPRPCSPEGAPFMTRPWHNSVAVGVIPAVPQDPAGQGAGVFAIFEQDL